MMKPPLISIITPTKNNESTIEKTILSVANQRYKHIEHILVDSTSSDKTVALILKYQKKYNHIRLISEPDKGAYPAMNKGIDMSNGKWIYFLGGDDHLLDDNTLTELFRKGVLSKYQVVYGNVLIQGDATWAKDQAIYDGPFDLQKLLTKNICHQAIFYPRRLIRKVGYFNPEYTITADWDYNLRCYVETDFYYVDQTIAVFNAGGISTKKGKDVLGKDFSQNVIQYFKLNPYDPTLRNPDNPFVDIIERFHKSGAAKKDKEIVIETDEEAAESLSILEQQELIVTKQDVIKNQQDLILQKERRIQDQGNQIGHLDETIEKQRVEIARLDETIKEQRGEAAHLEKTIKDQRGQMVHQDNAIKDQRDQMVNQYESIKKQLGQIVKLDEVIQNQHRLIQQKEELIHQQQEQSLRQEKVIKDQQKLILQKDNNISLHQDKILKKDQTIKEKQELILEKEKLAGKQEDQILQQQVSLKSSNDLILQKEELIIKHENLIQKNEEVIQKQVDQIGEYNERISGLSSQAEENEKLITTLQSREKELEKMVKDQTGVIEAKESENKEKQRIIEEKELIIDWKEKELSTVYHSYTWRIGKALLSPFTFIHKLFSKTSE